MLHFVVDSGQHSRNTTEVLRPIDREVQVNVRLFIRVRHFEILDFNKCLVQNSVSPGSRAPNRVLDGLVHIFLSVRLDHEVPRVAQRQFWLGDQRTGGFLHGDGSIDAQLRELVL